MRLVANYVASIFGLHLLQSFSSTHAIHVPNLMDMAQAGSSAQAGLSARAGSSARAATDRLVVAASARVGSSVQAAQAATDRLVVAALARVGSLAPVVVAVGSSAPVVAVAARMAWAYPLALAPVVAYPLALAPVVAYPLAPAVLVYPLVQDKSVVSLVQVVAVAQVMVTPQAVSFLLALALGWRLPAPPQKVVWPLPYYSELQWERLLDGATLVTDTEPEMIFLIGLSV